MTEPFELSAAVRAITSLHDIDTEIARLALLCEVRILEAGVVERVVRNDTSVCGRMNPAAFARLRCMLAFHFGFRASMADAHGQAQVSCIEQHVVDGLLARFPALAGAWSPASH
jgi:hypothetical protein